MVYRPLYNASGLWARPDAMLFETAEFEGRVQARFSLMPEKGDDAHQGMAAQSDKEA